MKRKLYKYLAITFTIITVISAYGYINSKVSHRYEVQDGRFFLEYDSEKYTAEEIITENERIDKLEVDIMRSININKIVFWLSLILSFICWYLTKHK